jgi:hypothetical protein
MSKNLEAFASFRDNLKNAVQHSNGDESFQGKVIYNWNGNSEHETLEITLYLTTFEYGRIRVEDGDFLNIGIVHMDFNPDFQDYEYTNEGFLVIQGKSPKLGGNYIVKIIEV